MSDTMKLIVRTGDGASQVAVLLNDRLYEFYHEEMSAESLVGAVFLGRVERVLPDIKAAFVRLGLPLNGFLPIQEAESYRRSQGNAPLMSNQEIIVQVKKDPKGGKGAFLTRDIAFAGQYVLVMPRNSFVGISKRISDEEERNRAKALGAAIAGDRFGIIVRHAALFARESDVRAEAEDMWARWQELEKKAEYQKAPALLLSEPSMLTVLARDYSARHAIEVCAAMDRPKDFPADIPWQSMSAMELDALWRGKRIESELREALGRRITLDGGGSLVIDEREALQTIDVNSGSAVTSATRDSLALEQNLAAVPEIARQIRLRNLSGIVLIDFIDMNSDEERAQVQAAMEQAVSDDRVKNVVHGFTALGLLEMTRKRTRDSLRDAMTEPCRACHESGRIISAP